MPHGREMLTLGHSTHTEESFVALLSRNGVEAVADVRRFPASRRLPHFNAERLERALEAEGIAYVKLGEQLGGLRREVPDSPNTGWRVSGFRGYADHMATPEFEAGLAELERLGAARRSVFMCAEGPWWRCHRQLIADALVARGWSVAHVMPDGRLQPHRLTQFALVEGEEITYPPPQPELPRSERG